MCRCGCCGGAGRGCAGRGCAGCALGLLGVLIALVAWTRHAMHWGASPAERAAPSTADPWLEGLPGRRVRMTRAISIDASPSTVWRWLAQTGRGAGWYSHERLDNGGRSSADHLVTWIPEPEVGDAAAVGYLRALTPGRELVWWAPDDPLLGARSWTAWQYTVEPEGSGSRLVMRVDLVALGVSSRLAAAALSLVDSIMAVRQLRRLRSRCERFGTRRSEPGNPETGARDQYQTFHVIYASGDEAGIPGVENARRAREWAIADGFTPAGRAAAV